MNDGTKFKRPFWEEYIKKVASAIKLILEKRLLSPVTEHQLIKILQDDHDLLVEFSLKKASELFTAHFMVYHCLYLINKEVSERGHGYVSISALSIQLFVQGKESKSLTAHDPLQNYYLDLQNLYNTTESDVISLLDGFWRKLGGHSERENALHIFSLPKESNWASIKNRYRILVQEHHPDKGGDKEKFIKYQNAMETLRAIHK